MKKNEEVRKNAWGHKDNYTTGCLLLQRSLSINCSWSKETKWIRLWFKSFQQIEFKVILRSNSQVCRILENSKETVSEFYKEIAKVFVNINGWIQ